MRAKTPGTGLMRPCRAHLHEAAPRSASSRSEQGPGYSGICWRGKRPSGARHAHPPRGSQPRGDAYRERGGPGPHIVWLDAAIAAPPGATADRPPFPGSLRHGGAGDWRESLARVCKRKVSPARTLSLDLDPWEQVGGADKYEFRVFVRAF